ncbi:MAG: transglutaminase domain-containing protein [Caulobacteraceae bacterium]
MIGRVRAAAAAFLLACVCVAWAAPAVADEPAVVLTTAPLVTPTDGAAYYDAFTNPTTHTVGAYAWTESGVEVNAPEIKAQAIALGSDRVGLSSGDPAKLTPEQYSQNVFDWVRNNIAVEFRYGLGKGARGALIDQSGTPFDQAELMVKLLREAGITASFQVGTITLNASEFGLWSGLVTDLNEANQTFNVDAKAACQFLADGGIPATVNGASNCAGLSGNLSSVTLSHIWVSANSQLYDPSFKRNRLLAGIDLPAAMGCGTRASPTCGSTAKSTAMSGTVAGSVGSAPAITNVNEAGLGTQLQSYAVSLQSYVQTNMPDASVEEIVGGNSPDVTFQPTVGSSLPISGGASLSATWTGGVPDQYRTTLTITGTGANGSLTVFADEIAGRRVELLGPPAEQYCCPGPTLHVDDGPTLFELDDDISIAINHPYAAGPTSGSATGAYADVTFVFPNPSPAAGQTSVLVLQVGTATSSTVIYRSGVETARRRAPAPPEYPGLPTFANINAAQFLAQADQANRLIEGSTRTSLNVQHVIGLSGNQGLSIATYVSVTSATSDTAARSRAFETFANINSMLEGSVMEQSQGTWPAQSTSSNFHFANSQGVSFVFLDSSNYASAVSSLPYTEAAATAWLSGRVATGQSIIGLTSHSGTLPIGGGTYYAGWSAFVGFKSGYVAQLSGAQAKGGARRPHPRQTSRPSHLSLRAPPVCGLVGSAPSASSMGRWPSRRRQTS